jgi:hypothetical protein
MLAGAARRTVGRGGRNEARALAPNREPGAIEGALEHSRAVRSKVDGAVRNHAALVAVDQHRKATRNKIK